MKSPPPDQIICHICEQPFTQKGPHHKNCSPRCAYISDRISREYVQKKDRDEAIRYYDEMFDDPLRGVGTSKYKPLVRAIYNYCEENGVTTFTHRELTDAGIRMCAQALFLCAQEIPAVSKTGRRIKSARGNMVIEWQLKKELLL